MEFKIEMLQDKLPASVYALLTDSNIAEVNISDADWHKARCFMLDLTDSGAAKIYRIKGVRDFTPEERAVVLKCATIETDFGISVSFDRNPEFPSPCYIPCYGEDWQVGVPYNMDDLQLVILENTRGAFDIYRVCHKGSVSVAPYDASWYEWLGEIWRTKLNPIRHAQWDRQHKLMNYIFRDLVLY